ncbi:MAG: endo-1,4-beta-xylanase [Lachnospiraceae bacterium]|nr:endo-1,4-beta-xylanase [Lachnospiraceae bacterium]
MLKKMISLAVAVSMVFSLTGCAVEIGSAGGQNAQTEETETTPEEVQDTEENADVEPYDAEEIFAGAGIETDIPDLRGVVASDDGLLEDAIVGACLGSKAAEDEKYMALIYKHFNAVTLENELKPDALFGYNNDKPANGSIHEEEFGGETIQVPKLDFSRADRILDKIADWNAHCADRQIKVRGHVLVWHSQTPEWFFHENYDKNEPYVTKDVMDKRLEWYIASVLSHYTGEESAYQGLFYGWDVVNEAVSDASGSYRTDAESGDDALTDSTHSRKSSWWKVYKNKDYIINAFRYANKYAPESVKLYYNDYNECDTNKAKGILKLLNDVKAADGTRIDGFGMQGHYTVGAPSAGTVADAAKSYAEVVDEVMITEFDVKSSAQFDGSAEKLPAEYNRQGAYYNEIYEALKKLQKEEGVHVSGLTFWGVIDTYSWLMDPNVVGGGADGRSKQCPLLFDGEYKAKPAFWAFADPSKIDMESLVIKRPTIGIKKGTVKVDGEVDETWESVEAVPLTIVVQSVDVQCEAKLLWDEDNLYVLMPVTDPVLNDASPDDYQQDSIEVFIDENNAGADAYESDDKQYRVNYKNVQSFNGEKCIADNIVSAAKETADGYLVEAAMKWTDITPAAGTLIGLELQVNDATAAGERSGTLSWADDSGTCYLNPAMFGHAKLED